ncbi:MAG: hypothetical protein ACLF0G_17735 [Candidatus Brocadiia bacterium]
MGTALRAFAGARDVSFTPDGQEARPVPCLERVDETLEVEEIAHPNADGAYDVFALARRVGRRVAVRSTDLAALEGLELGAEGVLRWTLVGKGAAGDKTLAARARVVQPVAYGSGDGQEPAVGTVVLRLLSPDGATDPIESE